MKAAPTLAMGLMGASLLACFCDPFPAPPTRPNLPQDTPLGVTGSPLWPDGGVELGVAQFPVDFVPFPTPFTFEHGPQGGIHLTAAYRVNGQAVTGGQFVLRVRREADGLLVHENSVTASGEADGGAWVRETRVFLCPPPEGIDLVGVPLLFELTVIGGSRTFLGQATARSSTTEADCH